MITPDSDTTVVRTANGNISIMPVYQGFFFDRKVRWKLQNALAIMICEVVPAHSNKCEQAANTQN